MVRFPDEEPFESQVPNLWLSSRKSAPAFKFSKRGKAVRKGQEEGEASRRACWKGGRGYCGIQQVRREQ